MSANSTFTIKLQEITKYSSFYINFITLIIGTIGGICNLITFTASKVRRNSCVFYLLCNTTAQLVSILFIVSTRMALDNFGSRLENQSNIFCKIRYYLILILPELSTFYMLLSIIDRCLAASNNVGVRSWSEIKVARQISIGVLIFVLITNIHTFYFYEIYNQTCQIPSNSKYIIFFAIYMIIIITLLPDILMLIFCTITFLNIKRVNRRVLPITNNVHQRRSQRFDSQLLFIIIIQVLLTSIFTTLRLTSYSYILLTNGNKNKTIEERAIGNFFFQLGISLYYFSFAISFYTSTLISKFFRHIFLKRIFHYYRCCRTLIL